MAGSQFTWEYLPTCLIQALNEVTGLGPADSAADLAKMYGTPPGEEFVRDTWVVLRDEWLADDDGARPAVVAQLWKHVGYADCYPSGHHAEVAFLRTCNNAQRLREAVLAEFLRLGERPSGEEPRRPPRKKADGVPVMTVPPTSSTDIYGVADRLWETADELRANSHLKSGEYSIPVLGLIFLKFADRRFAQVEAELAGSSTGRRQIGKANYQARGVLYLPEQARFAKLLDLREGENLGKAINDAMAAIEQENSVLRGVLPRTYQSFTNATLVSLLRSVNAILGDIEGDAFGKVYEYFLGKFAAAEGAKGGEYFTPTSIVRLIVEIIEVFSAG
jgi:HsdM N-terminal domain/N-6 DNA Methylase